MTDHTNTTEAAPGSGLVGLALIGLTGVGLFSTVCALLAVLQTEFTGAGTLAIAAALSFGLLLNAVMRR